MAIAGRTLQILPGGQSAAPFSYVLPASTSFDLLAVRAEFDGSAAAGAYLPCVQIISDAGVLMAQTVGSTVAAGASADVTFAPFLKASAATATGGGINFDTDPQTGDWLLVESTSDNNFAAHFPVSPNWPPGSKDVGQLYLDRGGSGLTIATSTDLFLAAVFSTAWLWGLQLDLHAFSAIGILNEGDSGTTITDAGTSGVQVVASGTGDVQVITNSGDIRLDTARNLIATLPTVDPGVSGALWNSGGVVKVSP